MQAWLWWKTRRKFYAPTFSLFVPLFSLSLNPPPTTHFSSPKRGDIRGKNDSRRDSVRVFLVCNRFRSLNFSYCSNEAHQKNAWRSLVVFFTTSLKIARFRMQKVNEFFIISYCALRCAAVKIHCNLSLYPMLMYCPFAS